MANVPGSNLLNKALSIISRQNVLYKKFVSRGVSDIGLSTNTYAATVSKSGSLQPVPRDLYEKLGLDLQKVYFTFYTSNDILDLERDVSSDQIIYNGQLYQCLSNNDWYTQDGWVGVLCVKLGDIDDGQ